MTQEEYVASLNWVELKSPNHPLLNVLRSGYTPMNKLYMQYVLSKLPKPEPKEDDPRLAQLYKEKKALYGRRAKLSNTFHDCKTNAERANVSDEIQAVQRQIEAVRAEIAHFEKTGEWRESCDGVMGESADKLPKNGVQLMLLRNSLRARISQCKRTLQTLAALPADNDQRKKIPTQELRLKDLQKELEHVESAIAKESV